MIALARDLASTPDVSLERRGSSLVQWDQPALAELGLTDYKPVSRHVCQTQPQGLGDAQAGAHQQAEQRVVGVGPQRPTRPQMRSRPEDAAALVRRVDMREGT